ncbi:homoserine dehydrogenase [Planococcus lenghuensis]|uniref:Homoserine dehydrogenase n=1 Tax=Planococcus lenghuensis TaxID=2213202 RepID=A0A1Q2KY94_9BACL|nr:homoserine dehydrogenase [Planococcus lenghuensis]AQQ53180.1 homoserine dehydrogenase [Planococcus lenghuensis]
MSVIRTAILGFGTVGEGVYRTIKTHQQELKEVLGAEVEVSAVLVQNEQKERKVDKGILVTTNFEEILKLPQLDIVFEAIVGKEPSFSYLKEALVAGCHIITANKEMFAEHGQELLDSADRQGARVGFEATVAGGVPIIQILQQLLRVNNLETIQGILNGTSNFILTEMRDKQLSFEDALALAQEKGFAEADSGNDIHGFDAYYKTKILSQVAFGEQPETSSFQVAGISGVTIEQIEVAERLGLRFKHVTELKREKGQVQASVQPVLVSPSHPFYHVEGVDNAVNVTTDLVGSLTLQGPGAGMLPTASAMVEDLVHVWHRPLLKFGKQQEKEHLETRQQDGNASYWLVSNLREKSFLKELDYYSEYTGNIHVVKAKEVELEKLKASDREVLAYPIVADQLFESKLEQTEVHVY